MTLSMHRLSILIRPAVFRVHRFSAYRADWLRMMNGAQERHRQMLKLFTFGKMRQYVPTAKPCKFSLIIGTENSYTRLVEVD